MRRLQPPENLCTFFQEPPSRGGHARVFTLALNYLSGTQGFSPGLSSSAPPGLSTLSTNFKLGGLTPRNSS